MTRIVPPQLSTSHLAGKYQPPAKPQGNASNRLGTTEDGTLPGDRAEISTQARQLLDLRQSVDVGRDALQEIPDPRPDRVTEAKQRLVRGYYHSAAVREQVAGRLGSLFREHDLF